MSNGKRVFFSVFNKTPKFEELVGTFCATGYELVASGGTYKHLDETLQFSVTAAREITGLRPVEGTKNVLDHRVETLCAPIHGGLLADEIRHVEEMERLGWPYIHAVVCTFYPLADAMRENPDDFEAINRQIDIGGPTMVRSATKGDKRIVIVDENDFDWVIGRLNESDGDLSDADIHWLQAKATATITQYVATEAVARTNRTRPK